MTTSTVTARRKGDPQHYVEGKTNESSLKSNFIFSRCCRKLKACNVSVAAPGVFLYVGRFRICSAFVLRGSKRQTVTKSWFGVPFSICRIFKKALLDTIFGNKGSKKVPRIPLGDPVTDPVFTKPW